MDLVKGDKIDLYCTTIVATKGAPGTYYLKTGSDHSYIAGSKIKRGPPALRGMPRGDSDFGCPKLLALFNACGDSET